MAAPSYASDLSSGTILLDMPNTTGWTALGGGASGLVAPETDFFIQGSNCISKAGWGSAIKGMIYNYGSGVSVPSGKAVFMWIYYWAPNALAVENGAPGGLQLLIGSSTSAYKSWDVRGKDTLTYGGWVCAIIDPTVAADDTTTPGPSGTLQYFGATANVPSTGPSKGQPLGIDAFRYGRDFTCTAGDLANGYATFAGAASYNDDVSRRFGQIQSIDGGYLMAGRFLMGSAATAVDFQDSNRSIVIARLPRVGSAFNCIEVVNAASNIVWTNISIVALLGGSGGAEATASRGDFVVTDNATLALNVCTFTDMGTFTFQSSSTMTGCTFRRCNLITQNTAVFSGCTFDSTNDAAKAVLVNDPGKFTGSTFKSSGTKHAMELTSACQGNSYSLTNVTFTGYGTAETADAAIYNNSGGAVTLNIFTGTTPTIRNGTGASTTVVSGSVSATVTVTTATGALVSGANVFVKAKDGTGSLPFEVVVTITNSGTTATVAHTGHGMATNDKVLIVGASLQPNNGCFSITKINDNSYSYTMGSAPGSNPTGTIKATYVLLKGTTDGVGQITMSRVFPTNQPVTGWARKSSGTPFYKSGAINGTVTTGGGATLSAVLVPDE